MYLLLVKYDVAIIGGGLAGLTASIILSKAGLSVIVLEKNQYPFHRVCGEYVSNEVRPFLENLGLELDGLNAVDIDTFSITNIKGKKLQAPLPLGGFGISRFVLDNALYELALANGVQFQFETALQVDFDGHVFTIGSNTKKYQSKVAIAAIGKRSLLDKRLNRSFVQQKSPWVGIKGHYAFDDFPQNEVALHCFPGGYGGLSRVENGNVNFCYLAHYKSFQEYKDVNLFNENVVSQNPYLRHFLQNARPVFKKSLSIAQISFSKKNKIDHHMVMTGDSAGLIHPLCGNGMAMAIHAAHLACKGIIRFFERKEYSRNQMEQDYTNAWKHHFGKRVFVGRKIQSLITNPLLINGLFSILPNSETILSKIIQQTHGKPILV